ncbi:MAG: hypothetical protein JRH11_05915 [Deltaproteobacteria bacterium]|nr:hypothetical protein [Deltaproteobacteria bacterium]
MSSSIKPPGSPPGTPPPGSAGSAGEGGAPRTGESSETFQKVLEEVAAPDALGPAKSATAPDAIEALAADAAAGRVSVDQVVDRLVSRALENPTAAALPPAQRAELEAHLRSALADDPALSALTQDLLSGG